MKIWIHVGGVQEGPYELDQLPIDRMDASTPVWYEGLADWTEAGKASATAHLFGPGPGAEQPQPQWQWVDGRWVPAQDDSQPQKQQPAAQPGEKCPASYLAWSIALTVLCCNPLGIIPIITGSAVRSKFAARDYDGAKRMSETTAWFVMILIVTSLMLSPLALASL